MTLPVSTPCTSPESGVELRPAASSPHDLDCRNRYRETNGPGHRQKALVFRGLSSEPVSPGFCNRVGRVRSGRMG